MEAFSTTYTVKKLINTLANLGKERLSLLLCVEDDIKKLRFELNIIYNVLNNAEEKQVSNSYVLKWLQDLKEFSYDMEDIFDEFETEIAINPSMGFPDDANNMKDGVIQAAIGNKRVVLLKRCKKLLGSCLCSCSRHDAIKKPIVARLNIAERIKELMKRFDDLLNEKRNLDLMASPTDPSSQQPSQLINKRPQTTSINDSQFVMEGRENEISTLKNELLGTDEGRVRVLSIIGMGGIGKSTLAKAIFNDSTVGEQFKHRKWVFVGEKFNPISLLKELLGHTNEDIILGDLHNELMTKCKSWGTFLIVLDDIWDHNTRDWEDLWDPLSHGTPGSVVLITSRSERIVKGTLHRPTILVKGLGKEICFSIFKKHAFPDGGFAPQQNLIAIGKEIVQHLGGLPLAAKVVGSSLFDKDETQWRKFRKEKPWETIDKEDSVMGSLKWSYNLLPTHLKQCFGYCSLLVRRFHINKKDMIQKWIAVGLIQPEGNRELEDIGDDYFRDLLQLSFFEEDHTVYEKDSYRMHDLIYDLARLVSSHECKKIDGSDRKISDRVRHLHLEGVDSIKNNYDLKKIRTVIISCAEV